MNLPLRGTLIAFGLLMLGGCHNAPDLRAASGAEFRRDAPHPYADIALLPVSQLTRVQFTAALAEAPARVALTVAGRTGASDLPIEVEFYDVGLDVHAQKYLVRNRSQVAFKGSFEVIYYDQYDNPIGEQRLSGLAAVAPGGTTLNHAMFTGIPVRGELVRGGPQDWPNACEIDGKRVSPCPVSLTVKTHNFEISQPQPIVAIALNQ
jgi:hypothetical protein